MVITVADNRLRYPEIRDIFQFESVPTGALYLPSLYLSGSGKKPTALLVQYTNQSKPKHKNTRSVLYGMEII